MSLYEKYVLPKFLNCACGSKPISYQRKKVVPMAEGKVLEIGIGSGLNLPFYDKSKLDELWGLDPSEGLSEMAKQVADEEAMEVNFISAGAEEIPLPDNHFDSVLVTYTMCTIPEVHRANKEIQRVLKAASPRYNKSLRLNPEKYVEADSIEILLILKKTRSH